MTNIKNNKKRYKIEYLKRLFALLSLSFLILSAKYIKIIPNTIEEMKYINPE